ncbi:MAG TPA: response regulator [Pirellulales bacterium]|nr:response regulator [Pirellulales bacterium]
MPTVLVVDDSAVDRRLATGLLNKGTMLSIETAENGAAALARMKISEPDVVVTDLQMPELDGLGLIKAVRIHHPRVPVVMMTAHGSEDLAVEALESGAASYVPKSQLSEKLLDTVEQVLAVSRADHSYDRLADCLNWCEFSLHLENDSSLIDPLVDVVQKMVEKMRLCDATGRVRIGVALEEALLNALYRGNLELGFEEMQEDRANLLQGLSLGLAEQRRDQAPYAQRKIFVKVQVTPEEARILVRDEGPGFDVTPIADCDDPTALARRGGRGMVLMRTFMDEVTYNDCGNEVTMVKRKETSESSSTAA